MDTAGTSPQIRPDSGRRQQQPAYDQEKSYLWIYNDKGQRIYILGIGVLPDDCLNHIKTVCESSPFDKRDFGRLHLGPATNCKITEARRHWLEEEGLSWKSLGPLPVLHSIGILTSEELAACNSHAKVKQAGLAALAIERNGGHEHVERKGGHEQDHRELMWEMVENLRPGTRQELLSIIAEGEAAAPGRDDHEMDG